MPKRTLNSHTVFVIPHTHWDREWYASFQQFRIRLVHMMDDLLDLLARDPSYTHFNLDGQTVVLQDYLEIRPEKREALQKYVRDLRLGVGPWYVLPDEFLVSGESLVRNLLLGHRIASDFGHVQKVGYIPDTFGHISQLPQILQGFGIPFAMHFRGLDEGVLKSELWWQSPDGSRVLLRHLPTDMGYGNACALAEEIQAAAADLQSLARYETRRAASSVLLALNGIDHLPAREDIPSVIETANRNTKTRTIFKQASLEEYFEALKIALGDQSLQTVYGELRDANRTAGRDNRLLPNILSSRIYNKIQNAQTQSLLEHWAEPWSALSWLEGEDYPNAFLWKSWEWLLQNHPHDSIGGCSIDAVHSQMETRFAWASEIANEITKERFELLSRRIDLSSLQKDEMALIVFNGLPWSVEEGISVDIDLWDFFLDKVALHHWTPPGPASEPAPESEFPTIFRQRIHQQWYQDNPVLPSAVFRGLRIRQLDSMELLPVQVESITRSSFLRPLVSGPASERRGACVRASFFAKLPSYGYQVYAVAPMVNPNKPVIIAQSPNVLENEYLYVEIASNGTLCVKDKTTGENYTDLGLFEDGGDCGDGYNYSYPLEDRVETSSACAVHISRMTAGPAVQRYQLDYEWALPEGLDQNRKKRSEKRVSCPLSVIVSLAQGSPRLDLQVSFDNHACDHRLRMVFPSDIKTENSQASAQFDVVTHPVHVEPVKPEAWVEDAPTTFPQQDWVDLSDGKRGLCIIVQGLPEYEVLDTQRREIAITLLRAVGYLGSGMELQTTYIGAGPNIATPEAQIQRKLTFTLSVLPHSGTWAQAQVWRQALECNNRPRAYCTGMANVKLAITHQALPSNNSFLSIEGQNVILSSLKKAEEGESLIVRLYNPSDVVTKAIIQLPFVPKQIELVGLDEKPQPTSTTNSLPVLTAKGKVQIDLAPKKFITLRMDRG